jgi:hypothetical protein
LRTGAGATSIFASTVAISTLRGPTSIGEAPSEPVHHGESSDS